MSRVRTRFAPSPTGSLHVGNVRTAVVNWLVARHYGGEFIVRIEDTDVGRNVEGAERALLVDLEWLGLDWDEGPDRAGDRGPHAPYRQSERGEIYGRQARRLLEAGAAYRCFCGPATLEAARARALEEGRSPRYAGTCRALSPAAASARAGAGEPHVLRLATPDEGEIVVEDVIRGRVVFDADEIGDFVLVRSDGVPTYNFAVVVDDAEMEISHVIRGAGHLSNTPHQLLVYRALDVQPPTFAHTPTVLGPDRKKLSKRSGARPLAALREEGLHPDAVLNYLSLLGWSSPSGDEVLSRDRLIREVTLERMNAGDVVFDPEKLRWMSARHIDEMTLEELAEATRPWVAASPRRSLLGERYPEALAAIRSHLSAFGEVVEQLRPFAGPAEEREEGSEELDRSESAPPGEDHRGVLAAVRETLAGLEAWEPDALQAAVKEAGASAGARGRELYIPLRRVLTGDDHGPPLVAILRVQGRETVLARLDGWLHRSGGGDDRV